MKRLIRILMIMSIPSILVAQVDPNIKGIKWEDGLDWSEIKEKAKVENKYIFLDAYATWCGPCKMMDKDVYGSIEVGTAINTRYLSVKVQMDSTINDDKQIVRWYKDAQVIKKEYDIHAYPSLLFFSPEGKLIMKEIGYKNASEFIRIIRLAIDYHQPFLLNKIESYKKGERDYNVLNKLALFTKKVVGDKSLAERMANEYINNHMNSQSDDTLLDQDNVDFIKEFSSLIDTKDKFFSICYDTPNEVDKALKFKGWANYIVENAVKNDELSNVLLINKKPVYKEPQWNRFIDSIQKKYSKLNSKKLVLDYQIYYYLMLDKSWNNWAKYKEEKIYKYLVNSNDKVQTSMELNDSGAWYAFLFCNDRVVLQKALKWIELAMQLEPNKHVAAYLDTKANLLYKLKRRKEAILIQKMAVDSAPKNKSISDAYHKMLNGEPTWPSKEKVIVEK